MNNFEIFPAIDLRSGQVVRLLQGDPKQQTTYHSNPALTARRWLSLGARWLHVVNLDGAFGQSSPANQAALQAILAEAAQFPGAQVQFGGGLRNLQAIDAALQAGVSRVVLGSLAVEAPEFAHQALLAYGPQRVALGLDVRDGRVRTRGWETDSGQDPLSLGQVFAHIGLQTVIYTNIERDGGQQGLAMEETRQFAQHSGLHVIASGGVGGLEDIRQSRQAGLAGVIIGRALYEGAVDLQEALVC